MRSLQIEKPTYTNTRIGMYSNPSGNFLELENTDAVDYVVFNIIGDIELQGHLDPSRKIDIRSLIKGIYFIQFSYPNRTKSTQQFIKS